MTIKVMTIYGTRPEAIKVAPVIRALEAEPKITSVTVTTGQHREMLDQVNKMFGITPDYDMNIMAPGQTLNSVAAKTIAGLDEIFVKEIPDFVLVQGDTTTVMAGAIAAFNREIPVVHLEAGLRTGNIHSPFPEEANRMLASQVTALHLAPTAESKNNLVHEHFDEKSIVITGNTVIDALLEAKTWDVEFADPKLHDLGADGRRIIMVTTHRRENINAMAAIGKAMRRIADEFKDVRLVLPAHLNPAVREQVFPEISDHDTITITDPLPYDQFIKLMNAADIVLTDSGGVQEEAPSLGKPVLVMRDTTERPEAVAAGTVKLVGTNEDVIVEETTRLLTDKTAYDAMAAAVNPYGDGKAASRSVAAILEMAGQGKRLPDFNPET